MKRGLAVVGALAASLLLAADAKDDAAKKELDKFAGTWQAVSIVEDGKEVAKDDVAKVTLTVKGENYTYKRGDLTIEGTHKLDPSKTPKAIDATRTAGPDKGKTILGIYELTDEMYKVCFAPAGQDRPTEFASKPGSGCRLIVMKRQKS